MTVKRGGGVTKLTLINTSGVCGTNVDLTGGEGQIGRGLYNKQKNPFFDMFLESE